MKHIRTVFGFCLAAAFLLTGCESVVKEAKPPEQYLDSQVLDGNFIDFSDPEQVYALYQAHYAAQQKDPNYKSYSELRGGLDMFGIPTDWSKNFISFDIVDYDEEKGNLIYALMTTNLTKSDSEYEYVADAEVTIGEDGKIQVKEKIEENVSEDPFLIAAVGFYNQEKDKNQFFFIDKDYSATRDYAGNGMYSLVAELEDDTVAVLYKEEILFYHYDSSQQTYVLDEKNSYNMKDIYTSTSFVSSAKANEFMPVADDMTTSNLELKYQISAAEGTVMTLDDQERMQSYMTALSRNNEAMADALLAIFLKNYSSDQLDSLLESTENWSGVTYNGGDSRSPDDFLACFDAVPITGANVEFQKFHYRHVLSSKGMGTAGAIAIAKVDPYDYVRLLVSEDAYFYVPFTIHIVFSGETTRTYEVDCEFYFMFGMGFYTNNVDWGDAEFTIHDIRYRNEGSGKLVPNWIQVEYSENAATSSSAGSSKDLMERLQALESSAETNVNQGNKWLDVSLTLKSVGKSYTVMANSQVEISSLNAISDIMDEERARIEQEIADNNEKYRVHNDVTKDITAKHIADLQTVIDSSVAEVEAAEEEDAEADAAAGTNSIFSKLDFSGSSLWDKLFGTDDEEEASEEESTPAVSKYASLSARFCEEDGQTDSDAELIVETGPGLLEIYKKIYDCQEKLKQQELYVKACQYLKVNDVYDQMLDTMDSKLEDYAVTMGMNETEKAGLREALDRQMVNRGLSGSTSSQDVAVDELMLPASLIGDTTDETAWETFRETTMEEPEDSALVDYLVKNRTQIAEKLTQTVTDLEKLKSLAMTAKALTENDSSFVQTSETAAENEDNFYTVGYEQVLYYYQNASDALEAILYGIDNIDGFRDELHGMEDEDIKISRFDLEISEERKAELLAECDRMETLLKTIYTGSSDADRNAATNELESTQWQIDVDCEVIEGKIFCIQEESQTRTYYETVWTATVNKATDAHNSYVFNEETSSLYFDEGEGKVVLLHDAPPEFSSVESIYSKIFSTGFFGTCETIHGEEFFQDMDQAVVTSVQYKNENTSSYANLPNNRCQIILLSQAEGRQTDDGTADPKWSFMALPYSKLGLDNVKTLTTLTSTLALASTAETLESYGFVSKMGVNNEMTYTYTVKDYATIYDEGIDTENVEVRDLDDLKEDEVSEGQEATEVEYEVKVRGMLREGNTIFLDNPKIDWTDQEKSRFYFLNLSLDEGIQLYALKPDTGTLERQKDFEVEALKNYTDGCWFMGWWYPDAGTSYNDQGSLGGGKLVLLGLTRDDMKTYSSEEDGSLRELVADDIHHSKLYEINISSSQMNACKK